MGKRTGKEPSAEDSFLWRICHAIDEKPRELAKNIEVPYKEFEPLLSKHAAMIEIDRDEVWWKIKEYVSWRMGMLLAVNTELNKRLQKDRIKRVKRLDRFKRVFDDGEET